MAADEKVVMSDINKLLIVIGAVIVGWLFFQLSPVLMPFFISALLAYLADPLVDKLESWKLSRTLSVTIVFAVLVVFFLLLLLILLPMLSSQIGALLKRLPDYLTVLHTAVQPWLLSVGLPTDLYH